MCLYVCACDSAFAGSCALVKGSTGLGASLLVLVGTTTVKGMCLNKNANQSEVDSWSVTGSSVVPWLIIHFV